MKGFYLSLMIMGAVVLSGCNTSGLSLREKGNLNYTNLIYGLYGDDGNQSQTKTTRINKPIKLAIAQVGENVPPQVMIDRLEQEKLLISQVVVVPAGGEEEIAKRMKKMCALAKDLGADYIFLFGGSADYGSSATLLQLLDITVVGAYIFPSNKIKAEARAAGALIDAETGRVLMIVNAEANKQEYLPTALAYDRQAELVTKLRDELVDKISANFINKLKHAE